MAKGSSMIRHPLPSPDTIAMVEAIKALGAKVAITSDHICVLGTGGMLKRQAQTIDAGNSGQVLRFIGALCALQEEEIMIKGDASICSRRPVRALLQGLEQLGAQAFSLEGSGYAPLSIKGPITSGNVLMSGEDSQPVSALLLATSFLEGTTKITVNNPGETPWVDLTLHWLKRFGVTVEHHCFQHYTVPGGAKIPPFDLTIPADFSSAAFIMALALITRSTIIIKGLDMSDMQGDKAIVSIFSQMGAIIEVHGTTMIVSDLSELQGIEIDANSIIDAVPILAVVGCFAEGTTTIKGAKIARAKESDRIFAMCTELKKMGAQIEEREDGLVVSKSALFGAKLSSYKDHRIALSLIVAALGGQTQSEIDDVSCIDKSYHTFFSHLNTLGALPCT
jgi:3-phosphoshikimate 1-carboxyvinyltransferase